MGARVLCSSASPHANDAALGIGYGDYVETKLNVASLGSMPGVLLGSLIATSCMPTITAAILVMVSVKLLSS